MATSFILQHDFPDIELDLFEEHLNHPELIKKLGAMPGMKSRELISEKRAGNGDTLWQFKVVVDSKLPRAMEKIISQEMMSWQESSRFSKPDHCIYWEMEPFMGKTKFQSSGTWHYQTVLPSAHHRSSAVLRECRLSSLPAFRGC